MSLWFKKYTWNDSSRLRLFCFPYAGGNAYLFSNWAAYLPQNVDLFALESPGRGRRFSEEPIGCLKTKVQLIRREILAYSDIPTIFVGHSVGALLAYEVARELQKYGHCNLEHIVISAKRAPNLPHIKAPIHQLPQKDFIEKLREYDFTPDEVLHNDELMEVLSPMLRADFSLSETHEFKNHCRLQTNATVFWGNRDKNVPFEDMMAWKHLIDGRVDVVEFDADHFFIKNQEEKFLSEINKIIRQVLS